MRRNIIALFCFLLSFPAFAQDVEVKFYAPEIVRIVKGGEAPEGSYAVTMAPEDVKVSVSSNASSVTYASDVLKVTVDRKSGRVSFRTRNGKALLKEGESSFTERTEGVDKGSFVVKQTYLLDAVEPVYGLGILQDGQLSLRGKTRRMIQGNTEDYMPVVHSVKGYALIWDNTSPTTFCDNEQGMSFESEVADVVDYYFVYGGNADKVISGIRKLTGKVPMLPLWSYGFMQSRERYKSSKELLEVLDRYRSAGIPLDCMIQDWQYWGSNYLWNAMEFLNEDFADGNKMIEKVHDANAHFMISIWSSFGPMTKQYREMEPQGMLIPFETWPSSGLSFWPPRMDYPSGVAPYDPFNPGAREIYWKHLLRLENAGVDGWWMDSTEPDHNNYKDSDLELPTAGGSFRRVRNAFPIAAVEGVYDHQREHTSDRRVLILTRSAYTGQQRTGANVWSGDIQSNWNSLRCQIPAGLGFALTGNPNFNTDLGGFFANRYNDHGIYGTAVHNPKYQELYVRWTQYGVFSPMMRSHGTEVPREIYLYGKPGEPVYDALVDAVKLRYALLPYIYSTAWQVSSADGTFQRALFMDFASDRKTHEIADEFMFGSSLLVAPVLNAQFTEERPGFSSENVDFTQGGKTRSVYFPAGSGWYDFNDCTKFYKGGKSIEYETAFDKIPVFVKAGSIIPIGPDVQYSDEKPWDRLEIRVYLGADGKFTLYEDEGDNYNYENGSYTTIDFTLKGRRLNISAREGSFEGMLEKRVFDLVLIQQGGVTRRSVEYDGSALSVNL